MDNKTIYPSRMLINKRKDKLENKGKFRKVRKNNDGKEAVYT